jgi:predicted O-methyltransferase YrrM
MAHTAKHEVGTTLGSHPELYPYVMEHINESSGRWELRGIIEKKERAIMMGAPDEASFLAWLLQLTGAKKVLEFGVFRGSTTLALVEALPEDGRVVGFDISEEYVADGRAAWKAAGLDHKVDLRIGDARKTAEELLATPGEAESYDLAFIDADKTGYDMYYELSLKLLKKGGIVAVDNVLWHGDVLAPKDADTQAIVDLNAKIKKDSRVSATMLPIADGLYLCRKL